MEVKNALNASEAKIQQLLKVNCHLSEELRHMQGKVGDPGYSMTPVIFTLSSSHPDLALAACGKPASRVA